VIAGMALKSEIMLVNQDRAKDLEYRVIPVNNSGQGEPSATISVVFQGAVCKNNGKFVDRQRRPVRAMVREGGVLCRSA
jgi:hypothetical protein